MGRLRNKVIAAWLAGAALTLAACEENAPEPAAPELSPETAQIPTIALDPQHGDGGVSDFYNPGGPAPGGPGAPIAPAAPKVHFGFASMHPMAGTKT